MIPKTLQFTHASFLKRSTQQADELPAGEKTTVQPGQVLAVNWLRKSDQGHILVELCRPLNGVYNWYAFAGHLRIMLDGKLEPLQFHDLAYGSKLAKRIIDYMVRQGHTVSAGPGEVNIIYLEGANPDGTLNRDRFNEFNDVRLVLRVEHGVAKIVGGPWEATSEPGRFFTNKPVNKLGAARIKFGQYKSWSVGRHRDHEALIQVAPITVHRDLNQDGSRLGDRLDTGLFGVNQHHGWEAPKTDVGRTSAGCLVGRTIESHRVFMGVIKSDPRYKVDRNYIFETTIIPGDKL